MATYTIGPSACTGTAPTGYHEFSGKVVLNETVDNANNQSTIAWSFYMFVNRAAYITGYSQSWGNYVSVTIDGKNVFPQQDIGTFSLGDGTQAGTHYESNPVLVKSGTLTVKHDDNGKKTLSVTAVYSNTRSTATYLGTITVSGSVELTPINRAATLEQPDDLTLTDAVYSTSLHLHWTDTEQRYYRILIKYRDAVVLDTDIMYASEFIWGVSGSVANYETNAKYMDCAIVLQTYASSDADSLIGSDSKQFRISFDESAFRPTFAPFSTQITWNDKLSSSIVAGQSYASGTWYAYGIRYATIVSEECTYVDADGNELVPRVSASNGATLPVIPAFSDLTKQIGVKIFLTDSRGFTTVSNTLSTQTVYGWMAPTITSLTAVRCDSVGTESLTGGYFKLTVAYSIRTLNNANAKNMAVKYKYQSDASYTQSSSGSVTNYSGTLALGPYTLSSAQDEKLEVLVEVWDSFSANNKTSISVIILPASVFIDIMTSDTTKIGLGIGMINDKPKTVQLGWDLEVHASTFTVYDEDGVERISLDFTNGLKFYNSSGTVTKTYPIS